MRTLAQIMVVTALVSIGATLPAQVPEKGGENETGPYTVAENWPQPLPVFREGFTWGSTSGVFAETSDRIFVLQRGVLPIPPDAGPDFKGPWGAPGRAATGGTPRLENCVLVVGADGRIIESWTQQDKLFAGGRGPHKVKISPYDPERHVWIVDDNLHQVFKFTHDGRSLVMTLGERRVPGNDERHFNRPTDIAWLPDGTFFVTDGYVNTRVVKFDPNGKFLMTWGKPGTGPGEFKLVHSITIDKQRRLYVADRDNSRIQVFDENGRHLDTWPDIRSPYHVEYTTDDHIWVSDGVTMKMLKYDLNGRLLFSWGTYGQFPGGLWGGHQFSIDPDGNLYIAEVFNGRIQRFVPKKAADPAQLVGQPIRAASSTMSSAR